MAWDLSDHKLCLHAECCCKGFPRTQGSGIHDLRAVDSWAIPLWLDWQEYVFFFLFSAEADLEKQVTKAGKSHLPFASSQGSPFHLSFRPLPIPFLWEGWNGASYSGEKGRVLGRSHHLGLPSYQSPGKRKTGPTQGWVSSTGGLASREMALLLRWLWVRWLEQLEREYCKPGSAGLGWSPEGSSWKLMAGSWFLPAWERAEELTQRPSDSDGLEHSAQLSQVNSRWTQRGIWSDPWGQVKDGRVKWSQSFLRPGAPNPTTSSKFEPRTGESRWIWEAMKTPSRNFIQRFLSVRQLVLH